LQVAISKVTKIIRDLITYLSRIHIQIFSIIVLFYKFLAFLNWRTMDINEISANIGFCGLICSFCHGASNCAGCRSDHNCCGRHLSVDGCHQFNCCTTKGINGCWECEIGPCGEDMFSDQHNLRNRVFVKVAKAEGVQKLAEYVAINQVAGIQYGWNKDYDQLQTEEAIIDLLHFGVQSKYAKHYSEED
jgi:hypothetical protein